MIKRPFHCWMLTDARKYLAISCGLVLTLQVAVAHAAEPGVEYDAEQSGVIERIDLASGTAVIGGLRYSSAPDLKVEINDSYGAFSMLKAGMFVRIYFREPSDRVRQLVFVEQVTKPGVWEET